MMRPMFVEKLIIMLRCGSHPRGADLTGQDRTRHQCFCKVPINWNVQPVTKSVPYSHIHTSGLITASFAIVQIWKQLKCPSTLDEWIMKMWYMYGILFIL